MAELILKDVCKSYDDTGKNPTVVLEGISLQVPAGGVAFLEGSSGSGKSTLLNLIAGLHLPNSGEIVVGGTRLGLLSESRRDIFRAKHIGYVFQTFNLLAPLTVLENLVLPARLTGASKEVTVRDAEEALERLGLSEQARKRPHQLSVGQRQRTAVARSLLKRPRILLADEPSANLDLESTGAVTRGFKELNESGTTLVLATHDPALREAFTGVRLNVRTGEVTP